VKEISKKLDTLIGLVVKMCSLLEGTVNLHAVYLENISTEHKLSPSILRKHM
jgi:hypothetical protein